MPGDKSTGLAAAANYLAGREGCVPGIRRRVCELWRMGKALGVCVMQTGERPPPGCV